MQSVAILAIHLLNMPRHFFETMNFDAITIAPYMGEDSVKPFLEFENKWAIVLGLTSNAGSKDFEQLRLVREDTNQGIGVCDV